MFHAIKSLVPRQFKALYWEARSHLRDRNLNRIGQTLVSRRGYEVAGGPFAGMQYVPEAFSPNIPARLLGCYEAELHRTIEEVVARRPPLVVDVGCAEGYYAVGLARRLPATRVIAYDINPAARSLCLTIAEANGVADRVVIRGECDQAELASLDLADAFLLSDCEGFEVDLLDPDRVPGLDGCELLVELHDAIRPGVRETILARFANRQLSVLRSGPRDPAAFPALVDLPQPDRTAALYDARGIHMEWVSIR